MAFELALENVQENYCLHYSEKVALVYLITIFIPYRNKQIGSLLMHMIRMFPISFKNEPF